MVIDHCSDQTRKSSLDQGPVDEPGLAPQTPPTQQTRVSGKKDLKFPSYPSLRGPNVKSRQPEILHVRNKRK